MPIVRRLVVGGLVALMVLTIIAGAIGMTMDADQTVTREATYEAPPAEVWQTINRIDLTPAWRSDIDSVELVSSYPVRFVEEGTHGPLPLEVRERDEEKLRLVIETYDLSLPFTAMWTYEIKATEEGTRLTVTEQSHFSNPLTRFGESLLSEPNDGVDRYLTDLGHHFGQEVTPRDP